MSDLWQVSQGLGVSWTVTVADGDGEPYVQYDGTELLAGSVSAGRDAAPLFTPTLAWVAPVAPAKTSDLVCTIPGSATATLDPGRYVVQIKLADGSAELYEGFLEVAYSPGTAASPTSYGSFADMIKRASWVEKFQRTTDLTGFADQRYQARMWFEDLLHRHYRGSSGLSTDFHFVPGVSFGGSWFGQGLPYRDGRRSKELQDWLDADRLDVTEPVRDAVSWYAIALLCDRQVAPAKDDGSYAAAARKYFARAEDAAALITAEIDSDGDGVNDTAIRLGVHDTLEG